MPLHSRCIIPRLAALSELENQRKVFAAASAKSQHSTARDGTPERNMVLALLVNEHINPEALSSTTASDLAMAKVNAKMQPNKCSLIAARP